MIATALPSRNALEDKIQKIIASRQRNKEIRYARVRERFDLLYRSEIPSEFPRTGDPIKDRFEFVMVTISSEFGLAKSTIQTIIKG